MAHEESHAAAILPSACGTDVEGEGGEEEDSDEEILNNPDKFRDESLGTLPAVRVRQTRYTQGRSNAVIGCMNSRPRIEEDRTRDHATFLMYPEFFFQCDRQIDATLQEAIELAKQDVLDCDGNISERNDLVQKLIRLRIQEYVMMERAAGPLPDFEKRGHALVNWTEGRGNFPGVNAKKIYCQVREQFSQIILFDESLLLVSVYLGLRVKDLGLSAINCPVLLGLWVRRSW